MTPADDHLDPLAGIDEPRPLPTELRAALEEQLTGMGAANPLVDADRPRALPTPVRAALLAALVAPSVAAGRRLRAGAVAAVIVLLAGVVAAASYATTATDGRDLEREVATPSTFRPRATTSTTAPATTDTTVAAPTVVAMAESDPAYATLSTFGSCEELSGWARTAALAEVTAYGLGQSGGIGLRRGDAIMPAPAQAPTQGPASTMAPSAGALDRTSDYSVTNVQEAGVDEPDSVKTDGRAIYTLTYEALQILTIGSTGTPALTSSVPILSDNATPNSLLLDGTTAIVLVNTYRDSQYGTAVRFVDVSDLSAPRDLGSLLLDGGLVDARLVGGTLHVVTTTLPGPFAFVYPADGSPEAEQAALAHNRSEIEGSSIDDWAPSGVPCESVRHPRDPAGLATSMVWSVDVSDPGTVRSAGVLADAASVYATTDQLVIATTRWDYQQAGIDDAPVPPTVRTNLHRFDLTATGPGYVASGSVPGYLHSRWALSADGDQLRVASTLSPPWTSGQISSSTVTVLDLDGGLLVPIGSVGGLGQNQEIQGVRFVGDVAYVVTFRRTDPLYTIDLSDPSNPRVRGALEVTGFSGYLHPLANGRLLGVGIEADDAGVQTGAAVSVYDVSDLDDPRLAQRLTSTNASYNATTDPHAFLLWEPSGQLVLPRSHWDPQTYTSVSDAHVLRLVNGTLAEQGAVGHAGRSEYAQYATIRRSLVIGTVLYTVSEAGVLASDLATLADVGWASLPMSTYSYPQPAF